jgi:hypothetical protein
MKIKKFGEINEAYISNNSGPVTVKDMKIFLENLPDEMEIITFDDNIGRNVSFSMMLSDTEEWKGNDDIELSDDYEFGKVLLLSIS